jgi:hypothetical protein
MTLAARALTLQPVLAEGEIGNQVCVVCRRRTGTGVVAITAAAGRGAGYRFGLNTGSA